jgi:hypothetical protein
MKTRTDEELQQLFVDAMKKQKSSLRGAFACVLKQDPELTPDQWPAMVAAAQLIIEAMEQYGAQGELACSRLASLIHARKLLGK